MRRAGDATRRAPVGVGVLAVLAVALPVVAYRGVSAIADSIGAALAEPSTARLVLAGFALPAAAGGAAIVVSLPRPATVAIGVVAAPIGRVDRLVSLVLLPSLATLTCVVPAAAATMCPLVAAAPGGWAALPGVVVGLAAAAAGGGCALVAGRGAITSRVGVRRRFELSAIGVALVASPLVALLCAADAVSGRGETAVATVAGAAALAGSACSLEWLLTQATPGHPARRRSWRLPRASWAAVGVAGLALLLRRRDVGAAIAGALVIGGAGLVLGRLAATPAPAGALVALGGALVVLAPVGLAVGGVLLDGREVWQLAPRRRSMLSGALAGSSLVLALLTGEVIALAATALGEADLADAAPLVAVVLGGGLSALLAGAFVPWTRAGVGGQAATLGAFGVVAGLAAICSGRIASTLPPAGLVTCVSWGAIGCAFAAATVAALSTLAARSA